MLHYKQINIEICIFLLYTSFVIEGAVSANFILYRTCYAVYSYNETDCAKLGTGDIDSTASMLESIVQPYTAVVLMVKLILESIIPALSCFFLGPWTDKYGRKPVLVYATIGYGIAYLIMLIVSIVPKVSPWYLMLAYIPISLTGGFPSLQSAMVCYITDVTNEENRGFRLGLLDAFLNAGSLLGGISSSFIFKAGGYLAVYTVCTSLCFTTWLFILITVPESITVKETKKKFTSIVSMSLVKETLKSTFKSRDFLGRPLILISILIQVLFYSSYQSEFYVTFLFVREKFYWSLGRFTIYTSINSILWIFGNIVGVYFLHKLLRISEVYIMIAGVVCGIIGSTWQGLSTQSWHVYGGASSKWLGGAVIPLSFSILSIIVTSEESGKIFAMVTAFKILGALATTPVYTWVYNNTLSNNPGQFNFVTVALLLFVLCLTIVMSIILKYKAKSEQSTKVVQMVKY